MVFYHEEKWLCGARYAFIGPGIPFTSRTGAEVEGDKCADGYQQHGPPLVLLMFRLAQFLENRLHSRSVGGSSSSRNPIGHNLVPGRVVGSGQELLSAQWGYFGGDLSALCDISGLGIAHHFLKVQEVHHLSESCFGQTPWL